MGEMGPDQLRALASSVHRQLSLIWIGAAAVAIIATGMMAIFGGHAPLSAPLPLQAAAFLLGGLASAAAAFFVPARLKLAPRPDSALVSGIPELARAFRGGEPGALILASLYQTAYQTLFLCYLPAFLGVVYLGLWQPLWVGFVLTGFSLLLLVLRFPHRGDWFARLERPAAVEQAHQLDSVS
jgi:hypothetical protein